MTKSDTFVTRALRCIRAPQQRMTPDEIKAERKRLVDSFAWDGDGQLVDHGRGGTHNDEVRRKLRELPRL